MKCETTNGYMALKTAELGGSLLKCMAYLSYSLRKRQACASNFNISHVPISWSTRSTECSRLCQTTQMSRQKAQFNWTKCPPFSEAPFFNLKASPRASFMFAAVHTHGGNFGGR